MRKVIGVLTFISFVSFCALLAFYIFVFRAAEQPSAAVYGGNGGAAAEALPADTGGDTADEQAETDDPDAGTDTDEQEGSEEHYESDEAEEAEEPEEPEEPAELPKSALIEGVPFIPQNPELPRGCEVTALASLLMFHGIEADKMTLADEVKKDETPRRIIDGAIHWGHPNSGFIGDMYNMRRPGYGVYHAPIFELLINYAEEDTAVDLTGCEFDEIKRFLADGLPVWAVINASYAPLHASLFETWQTPDGEVQITYRMHAAVITGYDEGFIYICDPLTGYVKTEKTAFIACWEQMGRQAIVIEPINL